MEEIKDFIDWIIEEDIDLELKFDILNELLINEKFNIWRGDYIVSTNVRRMAFDDERNELWIQFRNGDTYKYFGISLGQFFNILNGRSATRTEGAWGGKGKTPSVGAAVWQRLRDINVPFQRVGKGFWIKKTK
jgi:hypothetical protein